MSYLVFKVLGELILIKIHEIEREARLVVGVETEVQKLTSNFQAIYAVLVDAEERQFKEDTIQHWLGRLKDVSYDMDDVLDEWGTAILKSPVKGGEYASKLMRKVCSFICSSCFYRSKISLRHDIAHKIKELNKRVDDIAKEKDYYNFSFEKGTKQLERHITSSIIDVSEVKGRRNDKEALINMLLTERSQAPNPHVISIVGMGGIGKTTLAQLVYNDDKVKACFGKWIWVCVSDPFDEIRVAKAILESLSDSASTFTELESLLQKIQQSTDGKKFLLVLDDVWEEDSRKWKQLSNSLKCGLLGSKILVTTRNENVAKMMGCTDILQLGVLSKDESWSLFSQVAFSNRTDVEPESLEDIGRKIVVKCKGLPLAIKTQGGLLRFKQSSEEWDSVFGSAMWELNEIKKGLFAPLLLSYCDLPFNMRQCFSYCAVFPKDYRLKKDKLIKMWMAQGYFRSSQSIDMEMIGEECFKNLAARSFFQDFERDMVDGSVVGCKMHDMVHDFAQFLTKNECFIVNIDDLEESKVEFFPGEARHLMIEIANKEKFSLFVHDFKKLRSLLAEPSYDTDSVEVPPKFFNQLCCIRTLNLSRCHIRVVPSNIGELLHLRYIDLSLNSFEELPETMCELFNMQTLDLSRCENLRKLPCGLEKLVNLRHLNIHRSSSYLESFTMNGLERLSCLRELDEFVVKGDGPDDESCNLWFLKNLKKLRGHLGIRLLGDVRNPNDALKAELKNKKHLNSLTLYFEARTAKEGMVRDDEVIEALEPSPYLESLVVYNYRCITWWPTWIMWLTKLRSIRLAYCPYIGHLPPFGKLPSIEVLELIGLDGVKKVDEEFWGIKIDQTTTSTKKGKGGMSSSSSSSSINTAFPKLKNLKFDYLPKWEEWDDGGMLRTGDGEDIIIMPSLHSLRISLCPKLKALPAYIFQLTTLKELKIAYCPILEERFKKEKGENWLNISLLHNIPID